MTDKTLVAHRIVECGNSHIGSARNFLTAPLASAIARPDAANWIVAYAVLTLGVAGLGMFMKAGDEDTLSKN